MLLAEHATEPGVCGEAFNVTPETPISVLDLVHKVINASGKTHLTPIVKAIDLSQQGYFEHLSGEKIKHRLGWRPRFSLEEGLQLTYTWYAIHGIDPTFRISE
jgi:CDP-glucose 4,6-dehydratase